MKLKRLKTKSTMTMKKGIIGMALLVASASTNAQTLGDARRELDNENYARAKNMFVKLLADPSNDKNQVAYYLGNAFLKLEEPDSAKYYYQMLGEGNKSPWGYLASGRLALMSNDKVKAKELFDKAAIITKMKNSEVLYQVGDAWYKPEVIDLKQAIGFFEDAYKIDIKNSANMLALGDAYLDNNEGGKALSKYESAAEVNPKLAMAFIKIGRVNVQGQIYDDAIAAFKKAIALEPDNAIAHKELGESYYRAKKYDLAKPELKKYIDLTPEDASAKTKFISFLFQLKEYEQVVTEATQMLKEDTTNFILLRSLAFANYELKRYKEGYEYAKAFWKYAKPAKVKPVDYIYSARLASMNGDSEQALNFFKTALQTEKENPELIFEYGKALWSAKMYDEAVAQFSKKITDFGGGSLDYYYLGRANYSGKHYAAADSAFAVFAERNPTSPDGHIWRAKCNSSIDAEMKTGAALPHYQKFIELAAAEPDKNKRNLIEAYSFMTAYFANAKDMETAKANLARAAALDPNDEFVKELQKAIK